MLKVIKDWSKNSSKKDLSLFFGIALVVIVLDQLTKFLIELFRPNFKFLFFNIRYSTNTGAGFGILQGNSFILGILSLIAAILVIWYFPKLEHNQLNPYLAGLFLGGIVGNGIDRLFKNYVVDFMATSFWPSFNLADSVITISVILFIIVNISKEMKA